MTNPKKVLNEGFIKKGGLNSKPSTPRPPAPPALSKPNNSSQSKQQS